MILKGETINWKIVNDGSKRSVVIEDVECGCGAKTHCFGKQVDSYNRAPDEVTMDLVGSIKSGVCCNPICKKALIVGEDWIRQIEVGLKQGLTRGSLAI